jgi:predicted permease
MNWDARIRTALAHAGQPPADDVIEELAQHARAMYDAARADGRSCAEAERSVELQIVLWADDAMLLKRRAGRAPAIVVPSAASGAPLAGIVQDIQYAARLLRRQFRFTLLASLTMALGIGATTVLFSVTYGVLMKPLPWPDADRLVRLEERRGGNRPRFNSFSNAAFIAWRDQKTTIEDIAAWAPRMMTLNAGGDPERIRVTAASASLFPVIGARPLIGSLFDAAVEASEGAPVVVLSEGLWRRRLGGSPEALGRSVQLDGRAHTVIGILPEALAYPDRESEAWIPLRVNPSTGNALSMFEAVAKLRPGMTPVQAAAEATARARTMPVTPDLDMTVRAIFDGSGPAEISVVPLRDALTAEVRGPLVALLAAVALLFATATANVSSLQLARATVRRREMAIRAALGAGTARLARQLLIETTLLGVVGGAAGLAAAALLHRVLPSVLPSDFPRLNDVGVDATVVIFALGLSLLASAAIGLWPAIQTRRVNLVESLTADGSAPLGASGSAARARMLIMAGQVGIACVLLVGASLFGRTFTALLSADRGFDPSNVLTARAQLPNYAYTPERRREVVEAIVGRVRIVNGVTAATFTDVPPIGIFGGTSFWVGPRQVQASSRTVTPDYFAAMGLHFADGRAFTEEDVRTSRPVFIVNRAFARQYLGSQPVGETVRGWIRQGPPGWEVIGVVDNVRHRGVTTPPEPEIYRYRKRDDPVSTAPTFLVRTAGDPAALVPTLRALARQEDPSIVIDSIMTLNDRVMTSLARPRLYAILIGGFAGAALLIAAVGLYGVLSYIAAQRARELAVRAALGARPFDILRLVMGRGLQVTAAGLAMGLLASIALANSIATLLYGVTTHDALTFVAVPLLLLVIAAVACFVPALRAARMDPVRVLRQ